MNYNLQEGSFTLPPLAWQDFSMNVLRDDSRGISLVVSRGAVPAGSDYEQAFRQQWAALQLQSTTLEPGPFNHIQFGVDKAIPGIEVFCKFAHNEQKVSQYQLAMAVPGASALIILTYSTLQAFSDEDTQRWQAIKDSFNLNNFVAQQH